jgi:RNA polymerase sigma-70 factor (ECF subfamily)
VAGVERTGGSNAEACFDGLYESHHRALHAYFLGRTSDPEAAVDLLQEAFLRAWRNISKLRALPEEKRRYWLYAVARNLLTDHYRRRGVRGGPSAPGPDDLERAPDPGTGPEETVMARERVDALERAIRELPDELRAPLTMSVVGGMSSARIGEMLQAPAGTVRYRTSLARKRLAQRLRLEPGEV